MTAEYSDTWDTIRARDWDSDITSLPVLLGLIGAGNKPHYEQAEILRHYMRTAAWVPAPAKLKQEAARFLGGG